MPNKKSKGKATKFKDTLPEYTNVYESFNDNEYKNALSHDSSFASNVVNLEICLLTEKWTYMNTVLRNISAKTKVCTIRRMIAERHGQAKDLVLYGPDKKNRLENDEDTLEDLHIKGGSVQENLGIYIYLSLHTYIHTYLTNLYLTHTHV